MGDFSPASRFLDESCLEKEKSGFAGIFTNSFGNSAAFNTITAIPREMDVINFFIYPQSPIFIMITIQDVEKSIFIVSLIVHSFPWCCFR